MYSASKHAVTALTEGLRCELVKLNSKIRITVSIILYYLVYLMILYQLHTIYSVKPDDECE
jgi:short-subunit dehydrogenase